MKEKSKILIIILLAAIAVISADVVKKSQRKGENVLENSTVSFTITQPDNYTVTFNEGPERAVHIFANPIETDKPDINDDKVVYIGPGEWNIESIMLKDGQTLYLDGGAVVHGIINSNFAKNVTVAGRGILDGSHLSGWMGKTAYIPLKFDNCENVTLKDIIVLNSNAWVCQGFDSQNGLIDGIRIISARPNGDGITLQSCQNYEIKNCFVRSWDDSLVVKNYDTNSQNINFHDIQLWTDFAQSMEVGYKTNKGSKEGEFISDITFENITVLNNFHKPVISVHNADDAKVSDIAFKNIVVENNKVGSGDADEMPQENLTIYEAPEQSQAMEHPDFAKEEYISVIPEGINIAPDAKIEADSFATGYTIRKSIDSKTAGASYWEGAADSYPNLVTLDFKEDKSVHAVHICLCPDSIWGDREQTITVMYSMDGENYNELVSETTYQFSPDRGNEAVMEFDDIQTRYIRLVFCANTGGHGGQAAEIEVYSR